MDFVSFALKYTRVAELCVCVFCERCGSLLMSKSLIGLMTVLNLSPLIHKLRRFLSLERSLLDTEGLKGGNLSPWLCVFLCMQQRRVLNGTLLVITHLFSLTSYLFLLNYLCITLHDLRCDVPSFLVNSIINCAFPV